VAAWKLILKKTGVPVYPAICLLARRHRVVRKMATNRHTD
jgi:hypothetical protein